MPLKSCVDLIKLNLNSITSYATQREVAADPAIIITLMAARADHELDARAALARIHFAAAKPRRPAVKGKFGGNKQLNEV